MLVALLLLVSGCDDRPSAEPGGQSVEKNGSQNQPIESKSLPAKVQSAPRRDFKLIHVFVVLADNKHQGIVPVPAALGNGQDARNNLYWGALYGVKTFFGRSENWKKLKIRPQIEETFVLDVAAFQYKDTVLIAQAIDGSQMKKGLQEFFGAVAGKNRLRFSVTGISSSTDATVVESAGSADVVCFVGHNGLMDMQLKSIPRSAQQSSPKYAVVLACKSEPYFAGVLKKLGCVPLITTSGLMCPEAYTLEAIITVWTGGANADSVHTAAAGAYAKYQKCSVAAAKRLFVTFEQK
jgi:hypothetical protein